MNNPVDWRDALSKLNLQESPKQPETEDEIALSRPPQKLLVEMERKGRNGKTATIISGFTLPDDDISVIAANLKKRLGTGGSSRGGEILIQGDRRDDVKKILKEMGFRI